MERALAGRLRRTAAAPATGDFVAVLPDGPVRAVLPRRGVIARRGDGGRPEVLAANVDLALLATSLNRDLNPRRLARFLAITTRGGVEAVVLLTKADLDADASRVRAELEAGLHGPPVLAVSVHAGTGLDAVRALLATRRTAVLLGTSGVGKSTLLNALVGAERQPTRPVRRATTAAATRRCGASSWRSRAGRCSWTRRDCGSSRPWRTPTRRCRCSTARSSSASGAPARGSSTGSTTATCASAGATGRRATGARTDGRTSSVELRPRSGH